MIGIIGSGPAAFGVALGLKDRGIEFEIIDIGANLDPKLEELKQKYLTENRTFELEKIKKLLSESSYDRNGPVGQKTLFGDPFPYDNSNRSLFSNSNVRSSKSVGGFSRVWGATMLPFSDDELRNWPSEVSLSDLQEAYRRVAEVVPISGRETNLRAKYLLPDGLNNATKMDRNSERVHNQLMEGGNIRITIGRAPLAVSSDCDECSLCITGCPRDAIWSSDSGFETLIANGWSRYESGIEVLSFRENLENVTLFGQKDGKSWQKSYSKIVLAAGTIATGSILVSSNWSSNIEIRDSQTLFVPAIDFKARSLKNQSFATLAHTLLNVEKTSTKTNVHMQFYGWNNSLSTRVQAKLTILKCLPKSFLDRLTRNLCAVIVYFDSDESGILRITKSIDSSQTLVVAEPLKKSKYYKKALREILREIPIATFWRVVFLSEVSNVGEGYHSGASLPMGGGTSGTDEFGRPHGLARVTVVDSSILPRIPAGPITYTVMANAYRIGATSPEFSQTP